MTDEEKKAIEIIKFLQYKCIEENGTGMMSIYRIDDLANAINIILNLIEKQSKEIEELKFKYQARKDRTQKEIEKLNNKFEKIYNEIDNKNSQLVKALNYKLFMENKIKAKIEELQEDIKYSANPLSIDNSKFGIKVLQSLLEKE